MQEYLERFLSSIAFEQLLESGRSKVKSRAARGCEFEPECEVNTKLTCLQLYMDGYLGGITLEEILQSRSKVKADK